MTKADAIARYKLLIARYGTAWTPARVPDQSAWDEMAEINQLLTTEDRRAALGSLNRPNRSTLNQNQE
jgi:hypothetical protein